MFLQGIIFALVLVTNGNSQDGLTCNITGEHLECVLSSKYVTFDISSQVEKNKLEEVKEIKLIVGTSKQAYEPPVNSSGIVYPEWGLMKRLNSIQIQFNLKTGSEGLSHNLEGFQYMSVDSFKGVIELERFEVSSNSAEVRFEVDMVSRFDHLERLRVEGTSIDGQGDWSHLVHISDLKLSGLQIRSYDLGWLSLEGLTSLNLGLKEIKGINETMAAEMPHLSYLSLTVSQTQKLDWAFIKKIVEHLTTLKLDGFALGDIRMGTIQLSSSIQHLTLSHSSNTRVIEKYSFNNANYTTIELRGMEELAYIEKNAFSGAKHLETLTITGMPILTELTQSLGEEVAPNIVVFSNNSKLAQISMRIFQAIRDYREDRPTYVDVRDTQLDSNCSCQASYLAAMSECRHVKVKSNCLVKWVDEKLCKQNSCWTFDKRCNGTCSIYSSDPFEYRCTCESGDLALLPDGRTCASIDSCYSTFTNQYNCTKYNAICYKDGQQYSCYCEDHQIWSDSYNQCVKDSIIPLASTISTKYTLIPLITNSTTKSMIPLITNSTKPMIPLVTNSTKSMIPLITNSTKPMIPLVTNSTKSMIPLITNSTKPMIPLVTNSTKSMIPLITNSTKPMIPLVTNSTISGNTLGPTILTFKTLHPPTPHAPAKSIQPATKIQKDITLVPAFTNSTKHTITANSLAPGVNITTVSSLPAYQEVLIGVSALIALLIIIAVLLLVAFWFYRRKKATSQFELRNYSPRLLDSGDDC